LTLFRCHRLRITAASHFASRRGYHGVVESPRSDAVVSWPVIREARIRRRRPRVHAHHLSRLIDVANHSHLARCDRTAPPPIVAPCSGVTDDDDNVVNRCRTRRLSCCFCSLTPRQQVRQTLFVSYFYRLFHLQSLSPRIRTYIYYRRLANSRIIKNARTNFAQFCKAILINDWPIV